MTTVVPFKNSTITINTKLLIHIWECKYEFGEMKPYEDVYKAKTRKRKIDIIKLIYKRYFLEFKQKRSRKK